MSPRRPTFRALPVLLRLSLLALAALAVLVGFAGCGSHPKAAETLWTCPMHPDYVSDHPGDCPICNMRLVRKREAKPKEQGTVASSPASGSPSGLAPIEIPEAGLRLAGVQTEAAREEEAGRTIRAAATVLADERRTTQVHTRIAGWVEKLYVNATGQAVRRGQPMLELYSPELLASQEEFLRSRAAEARFAGSSLPEVRQGGADLVVAARRKLALLGVPEAEIQQLESTSQARRTVRLNAPASGYVQEKQVLEGQRIEPETALFQIVDLSRVWLEASFYEADAPLLRPGLEATVALPSDPNRKLRARATYIYPALDPATRTLRVRFELANPGLALKPGMFADVELALGGSRQLTVPDSSLLATGERTIVFVETGPGRFEPRQVEAGTRTQGRAVILSGLRAGEKVAIRANFLLDSESQLRAALAGHAGGKGGGKTP